MSKTIRNLMPLMLILLISSCYFFVTMACKNNSEPESASVSLDGRGGGLIAFYSNRNGTDQIYVMNADGSGLRQLTNTFSHKGPAFSTDGSRIAYISGGQHNSAGGHGNCDIWVMNTDGSNPQQLTDTPFYESHSAWSPDGTKIAFISDRDGNREIYVMNADGSSVQRLTNNPAEDMRPSWSPDGNQIVFNSIRDGNWEIYIMDKDGSNLQRLTSNQSPELFPSWSPDGTRIAYALPTAMGVFDQEIYVMNVDGTNVQQLTDLPGNRVSENPIWSPDGSQIVFQSNRDGNFEIYIMDSDGGNQHRLTNNPAADYWPTWGSAIDRN